MILQTLHQLAQSEGLVEDPDFEPKPVAWLIRIDCGGKLLGIVGTHYIPLEEKSKKKPRRVAKARIVPRLQPSRSGQKAPPEFFVDNAKYVFGIETPDKPFEGEKDARKARERAVWFKDYIAECALATKDEGAEAILQFLNNVASGTQAISLDPETRSNDLFSFVYAPDIDMLVSERPAIKSYWRKLRAEQSGEKAGKTCLVSGSPCTPAKKHRKLKNVPMQGGAGDIALISCNKPAFWSYGWKESENAPISDDASFACATALNRLLHPAYPDPRDTNHSLPRRNLRISADTVVCYWSPESSSDDLCDAFSGLLSVDPDLVRELYQSIWRGKTPLIKDKDTSAFYALTLTGTQGRAIVRDWFESTVADVAGNLARHFEDLSIVRNTPKPKERDLPPQISLIVLLESLAPLGNRDEIPAHLAGAVVRSALTGSLYPFSLLQRAIERARAEIGRNEWPDLQRRDARAALIKAVLNRRKRLYSQTSLYKEVQTNMDQNNHDIGYLLGRLMAVIERMQQTALNDVNASVVDRFFSGASAAPMSVFPRLMKNLRHHARKAKDSPQSGGTARWLESQVDGIAAHIASFPPHLTLEQQGLFILGYHHQRNWLWTKKEDREAVQAAG